MKRAVFFFLALSAGLLVLNLSACGGSAENEMPFPDGYNRQAENPFYNPSAPQIPLPNDVKAGEPVPLDKYDLENLHNDYFYYDDDGVARWYSWEVGNQ